MFYDCLKKNLIETNTFLYFFGKYLTFVITLTSIFALNDQSDLPNPVVKNLTFHVMEYNLYFAISILSSKFFINQQFNFSIES